MRTGGDSDRVSGGEPGSNTIAELASALAQAREREIELGKKVKHQQQQLAGSAALLHEVNHRAKNNLQMAVSLLSIQANASESAETAEALRLAAQRVGYLAQAHELLYRQNPNLQKLPLDEYLSSIVHALREGFSRPDVDVSVSTGRVKLAPDKIVYVGLIVGEASLNALKHAFQEQGGSIRVSCRQSGDDITLRVEDDGSGFVAGRRSGSLGLRLIRSLGRGLGGDIEVKTSSNGTTLSLTFRSH